jgi:hypothetical protein
MDRKLLDNAPIGRIYDPLLLLAQHIHRAMAGRNKVVWTDAKGYVFVTAIIPIGSVAPHAIVGIYGKATMRSEIECALRLALRERASGWILDWNAARQLRLPQMNLVQRRPSLRGRRVGTKHNIRAAAATLPRFTLIDDNPTMA